MSEPFRILILCDVQNVFYGAKSHTHNDGRRVDYRALREVVAEKAREHYQPKGTEVEVEAYAYVVQTPENENVAFFALLRKCEFYLKVRHCEPKKGRNTDGSVASMMQLDLLDMAAEFDVAVVISGSGIFGPAFSAIQHNWPEVKTMLAAFKSTVHHVYTGEGRLVDEVIILGDEVVRHGR